MSNLNKTRTHTHLYSPKSVALDYKQMLSLRIATASATSLTPNIDYL